MNLFSLIIGIGASFGLLRAVQNALADDRWRWLLAGLITLTGTLLGARAGFVTAFYVYFKTHPREILQLTQGGLSWPGALTGAILFAWLALAALRLPKLAGFDRLSRMLLPLGTSIWLAGWQAGIAYGKALPLGTWWGMMITDDSGLAALRVPVQPAAVISLILLLGISEWLVGRSSKPGLQAGVLCGVLCLHSLLFSLMREDMGQRFFNLRVDSWAAIVLLTGSLLFLLLLLLKKQPEGITEIIDMER